MLGQGKGGAGDRFRQAKACGQTLHQAGFARTEGALQQHQARRVQSGGEGAAEGLGGLGISQDMAFGSSVHHDLRVAGWSAGLGGDDQSGPDPGQRWLRSPL